MGHERYRGLVVALLLVVGCGDSTQGDPDDAGSLAEVADGGGDLERETADVPAEAAEEVAPALPCLVATPGEVDFGAVLVGTVATQSVTLSTCSEAPVTIDAIGLDEGSAEAFSLVLGDAFEAPGGSGAIGGSEGGVTLAPGGAYVFEVRFAPKAASPVGVDGSAIPSLTRLNVGWETFGRTEVPVSAVAIPHACPTAVIKVAEGEEVIPGTVLHLSGEQSYFPGMGPIQKYQWSVQQPAGSASTFVPNANAPNPTFEANVQGVYTFSLEVWGAGDVKSCGPAQYSVIVLPDNAIRVELGWDTPGLPDTSEAGFPPDLDLHFAHPFATGYDIDGDAVHDGWFDNPFDVYWFNPNPDWGAFGNPDDNPELHWDKGSSEVLWLNVPEDGMRYRVGAHYWNDHGFGPSVATVRIYVYDQLVFESEPMAMVSRDFCEVATIDWPAGTVLPVLAPSGGYACTPDFQHPLFVGE